MRRKFKAMQRDINGKSVDWRTLYMEAKESENGAVGGRKAKTKETNKNIERREKEKQRRYAIILIACTWPLPKLAYLLERRRRRRSERSSSPIKTPTKNLRGTYFQFISITISTYIHSYIHTLNRVRMSSQTSWMTEKTSAL